MRNATGGVSYTKATVIPQSIWEPWLLNTPPDGSDIAFRANSFDDSLNIRRVYLTVESWKERFEHIIGKAQCHDLLHLSAADEAMILVVGAGAVSESV